MESQAIRGAVNNDVYRSLGERWYEADDDPIALLRALSRLHVPWIAEHLDRAFGRPSRVLDVGCGAGIGANALALRGHDVCGVDLAGPALEVAARHDTTGRVRWIEADARALPFADDAFDAVTAMDFLEHVDAPERVVAECARVLAPGGLFFFHTFDRNLLSWLVVIKGVEWFVRNVPRDMHVLRCFISSAGSSRGKASKSASSSGARRVSRRRSSGCSRRGGCPASSRSASRAARPPDTAASP
jgi:2-polyprenyl-6-hydroxyphenyl methylase/3-demethylubiquinone-9 3-methyltransferase